jgi:hypothetical protein
VAPAEDDPIDITLQQRGATHGNPILNLGVTAELWNVYLAAVLEGQRRPLDAADVATMMTIFKAARICTGDHSFHDHYADMAGYATLARRLRVYLAGQDSKDD